MVCTLKHLSLCPEMEALYLFNPENDMALACGDPYYMAPASARRMAAELSMLPAWYAEEGGTVWLDSAQRMKTMERQSFLPLSVNWVLEFVPIYNKVIPWGWNPSLVRRLQEAGFPDTAYPSVERMKRIRQISGRQTAVKVLRRLCRHIGGNIPILGEAFVLSSTEEVKAFVLSHSRALLKAPWSGSGRGIQYVSGSFPIPLEGWIRHILTTQHEVIGEPLYDKLLDFAMEFCAGRQGVEFIGWSVFSTGLNGEYRGNYLGAQAYIEQLLGSKLGEEKLQSLKQELPDMIAGILPDYRGYLGIDMMIYSDSAGKYRVQPCLEINLRYNMGIVALMLSRRYLDEHAEGEFTVRYYAKAGEAWQEHRHLQQLYPAVYKNNRIKSGYLNLTPVNEATHFVASLICY